MNRSVQQEAAIAVMQAAGRIRRQFGDVLGEEGIGASQYNILRILRGEGGPLPIMTVRARMFDPEPSITRLIDRLVERGLAERERCENDRRRVECTITAEGLAVIGRLDEPVDRRDRELMARFTERELETLSLLLERVGEPE